MFLEQGVPRVYSEADFSAFIYCFTSNLRRVAGARVYKLRLLVSNNLMLFRLSPFS